MKPTESTTLTEAPKTTPIVETVAPPAPPVAPITTEAPRMPVAEDEPAPAYLAELSPTAPIDRAGLLDKMHSDAATMAAYGQALARAAALAGLSEEWETKPDDTPASILARVDERIITNAVGEERFEELKKLTEDSVVVARARNLALAYEVRGTLFGEGRKFATFSAWSVSHKAHGITSEDYARRLALAGLAPSALLLLKAYGTAPIMKLHATTQEAMEVEAAEWVTKMKGATGLLRTMSGVKAMALLCPPEPKNAPTVEPKDNKPGAAPKEETSKAPPAATPPTWAQIADPLVAEVAIVAPALTDELGFAIPTGKELEKLALGFLRLERNGKPGAAATLAQGAYVSVGAFGTMLAQFMGQNGQAVVKVEREQATNAAASMVAAVRKGTVTAVKA